MFLIVLIWIILFKRIDGVLEKKTVSVGIIIRKHCYRQMLPVLMAGIIILPDSSCQIRLVRGVSPKSCDAFVS